MKKKYFPMFVDLSDKRIVVVGGGNIATRRVKTILQFTRNVTCVAPTLTSELVELGRIGVLTLVQRPVRRSDLENAYMVVAATNDRRVNEQIYLTCKEMGIYVNVADDREKCDFYFPGVFIQDELVVGITASGMDHKRARKVRIAIEQAMQETYEDKD